MTTLARLITADFVGAEYGHNTFLAQPDTLADRKVLFERIYWSNVARNLKRNDIVRVIPKDETCFVELLVREVTLTGARMTELRFVDLPQATALNHIPDAADMYKVQHLGVSMKWCVIRKADNAIVVQGKISEQEAEAEVEKRVKESAQPPVAPAAEAA